MEVIKKTILQAVTTGFTQGYWNADINMPDITSTTQTGYMWNVLDSGHTVLGNIDTWNVGDWAIKTNDGWGKLINTDIISGSSGNTIIVSNLDTEYYMKIGLKQETQDVGFFDIYSGYNNYGGVDIPIGIQNLL